MKEASERKSRKNGIEEFRGGSYLRSKLRFYLLKVHSKAIN